MKCEDCLFFDITNKDKSTVRLYDELIDRAYRHGMTSEEIAEEKEGLIAERDINIKNSGACHRYPKIARVFTSHYCGEFKPKN